MRIVVLGGTVFLSRAIAERAVAAGHEVLCLSRRPDGVPDGAVHVRWDRAHDQAPDLESPPEIDAIDAIDAVVDVARQPSWVRRAVAIWPQAHWTFVSTINVHASYSDPLGEADALQPPRHEDADLSVTPEAYGPMKVACEQIVREQARRAFVVRPGLIVGPGDPSGRFTYWPARLADASGPVLAGGSPHDLLQLIDVRDLAAWIVHGIEHDLAGDFDAIAPARPVGEILAEVAAAVDATPSWVWADDQTLADHEVAEWMGPRSLPLWFRRGPRPELFVHDVTPALAAGLTPRPIAQTARDTLAWQRSDPDAGLTGLTRAEEAAVLTSLLPHEPAQRA